MAINLGAGNWTAVPNDLVVFNTKLTDGEYRLLTILLAHTRPDDPTCFPGDRRLCALNGSIDERTLRRRKASLRDKGLITIERERLQNGRYGRTTYTLHLHPSCQNCPSPTFKEENEKKTHSTTAPRVQLKVKAALVANSVFSSPTSTENLRESPKEAPGTIISASPTQHTQTDENVSSAVENGGTTPDSEATPADPVRVFLPVDQLLTEEEEAAIEWTIEQYKIRGTIRTSEGVLRTYLVKAAVRGELDLSAYRLNTKAEERREEFFGAQQKKWAAWEEQDTPEERAKVKRMLENFRRGKHEPPARGGPAA